ncbi:MAG: AbrB/MazE/SpoVT family DNA-binding domain-containing protein [Bacilli bacterium]
MKFLLKYSSDGRITLPREIRNELKLQGGIDVTAEVIDGKVIISVPTIRCNLCGIHNDVKRYTSKDNTEVVLCSECKKVLEEILNDAK